MSDYIKREDAIKALCDDCGWKESQCDKDSGYWCLSGGLLRRDIPSIKIVKCKDCKHWHKTDRGITYCDCITYGFNHIEDDFCSHGELK